METMGKNTSLVLSRIELAISEAERFLQKARAAHIQIKYKKESDYCSPAVAATKRASMDLTKALAQLRKGSVK